MKKLFLLIFLMAPVLSDAGNISGSWKGEIHCPRISSSDAAYQLEMWAKKGEKNKWSIHARTEYAILNVKAVKLSFSDAHAPTEFTALMLEEVTMKSDPTYYHVFRFEFLGNVSDETTIEGSVEHSFDNHPYLLRDSCSFTLNKVSEDTTPPWLKD